jgi:hypothetical protein
MNPELEIKVLCHRHLTQTLVPGIVGLVEGLFRVATATGNLSCTLDENKSLHFFVRESKPAPLSWALNATQSQSLCTVEHEAARIILRMICARLGVLCKDLGSAEVSPYGGQSEIAYELHGRTRWSIAFTNVPDRQEFAIEAL